jgi:wyosine [tRNA(Phe)-imidazoG37] synthetase (radical SAM superfamily)
MPSLWARTRTTLEMIKWEHSIFSSVVWLYGRNYGRHIQPHIPYWHCIVNPIFCWTGFGESMVRFTQP